MSQTFLLLAIAILTAAAAQFLFKKGVTALGDLHFSLSGAFSVILQVFQNPWLLIGVILFGTSFVLWLFVLSKLHLNIAYPITVSLQIVILSVAGMFFLRESLSLWQMLGIVFIVFGIFLLLTRAVA